MVKIKICCTLPNVVKDICGNQPITSGGRGPIIADDNLELREDGGVQLRQDSSNETKE